MTRRIVSCKVAAIGLLLALCGTSSAPAGWWHRCGCHYYSNAYGAPASDSPSQAPSKHVSQSPAYGVMYYPLGYQPSQTPVIPQNFVSEFRGVMELISLIRELRGRSPDCQATESTSDDVKAALTRLEDGQKEIRGRLINIAGISQSIGSKLVEANERIATVEQAVGSTGALTTQLKDINQSIRDLKPNEIKPAQPDPKPNGASAAPPADVKLQADVSSLKEDVVELKTQLSKIQSILMELNKRDEENKKAPE